MTLNLTAVVITAIICLTLVVLYVIGKDKEGK